MYNPPDPNNPHTMYATPAPVQPAVFAPSHPSPAVPGSHARLSSESASSRRKGTISGCILLVVIIGFIAFCALPQVILLTMSGEAEGSTIHVDAKYGLFRACVGFDIKSDSGNFSDEMCRAIKEKDLSDDNCNSEDDNEDGERDDKGDCLNANKYMRIARAFAVMGTIAAGLSLLCILLSVCTSLSYGKYLGYGSSILSLFVTLSGCIAVFSANEVESALHHMMFDNDPHSIDFKSSDHWGPLLYTTLFVSGLSILSACYSYMAVKARSAVSMGVNGYANFSEELSNDDIHY